MCHLFIKIHALSPETLTMLKNTTVKVVSLSLNGVYYWQRPMLHPVEISSVVVIKQWEGSKGSNLNFKMLITTL